MFGIFSFINQLNGAAFLTTSDYEVQLLFFAFGKCILIIKKRGVWNMYVVHANL